MYFISIEIITLLDYVLVHTHTHICVLEGKMKTKYVAVVPTGILFYPHGVPSSIYALTSPNGVLRSNITTCTFPIQRPDMSMSLFDNTSISNTPSSKGTLLSHVVIHTSQVHQYAKRLVVKRLVVKRLGKHVSWVLFTFDLV